MAIKQRETTKQIPAGTNTFSKTTASNEVDISRITPHTEKQHTCQPSLCVCVRLI